MKAAAGKKCCQIALKASFMERLDEKARLTTFDDFVCAVLNRYRLHRTAGFMEKLEGKSRPLSNDNQRANFVVSSQALTEIMRETRPSESISAPSPFALF